MIHFKNTVRFLLTILIIGGSFYGIGFLIFMRASDTGPPCEETVKEQDIKGDQRGTLKVREARCSSFDTVSFNSGPKYYKLFDDNELIGLAYYDDVDARVPIQFYHTNRIQTYDPHVEYNERTLALPYQYNVKKKKILFNNDIFYNEDIFLNANYINQTYYFSLKTPHKNDNLGYIIVENDRHLIVIEKRIKPYKRKCLAYGECIPVWDGDPPLPEITINIQTPEESEITNNKLRIIQRQKININGTGGEKITFKRTKPNGEHYTSDFYLLYGDNYVFRFSRYEDLYSEIFADVVQSFRRIPIQEKEGGIIGQINAEQTDSGILSFVYELKNIQLDLNKAEIEPAFDLHIGSVIHQELSPNKQFLYIATGQGGGVASFIYKYQTEKVYFMGNKIRAIGKWTQDGLLDITNVRNFGEPAGEVLSVYQSINNNTPWITQIKNGT